MATAPPLRAPMTREQLVNGLKLVLGGLATAVLGGLFAALFTYYATERLNNKAALQQQYLAAVQDFNSTGAHLDASITELADNVLDGLEVRQARREARQAIAAHVAATQALSPLMGTGNVAAYMKGLATLRLLVDQTGNSSAALRTSRARFDLMHNRTIMVSEARRRIAGRRDAAGYVPRNMGAGKGPREFDDVCGRGGGHASCRMTTRRTARPNAVRWAPRTSTSPSRASSVA